MRSSTWGETAQAVPPWRFSQLSWAIWPYFEICFAYQGAGPDKLQMSTTVKSFFLITFKTLSKVLHTHASRQGKRKKSMALEEGSNSNISLLLQIPLVTDKGKDILHVWHSGFLSLDGLKSMQGTSQHGYSNTKKAGGSAQLVLYESGSAYQIVSE